MGFLGGRNEYHRSFPSRNNHKSLIKFLSASSISTTMHDLLLQKSTNFKKEGNIFTKRQESSLVMWPSRHEIGPGSITLTVAWTFATMWPHSSSSILQYCILYIYFELTKWEIQVRVHITNGSTKLNISVHFTRKQSCIPTATFT